MSVVDDYLARVPAERRPELARIRKLAKQEVPDAEEVISYGMPTLKYRGQPFLGFDIHKHHIGLYPYGSATITALKADLKPYKTSSGAIQIPFDTPIPEALLHKIIVHRLSLIQGFDLAKHQMPK